MWLGAIVLDTDNAENLSDFYKNLLGWEKSVQDSDGDKWISLMDKNHKYTPLVFQENPDYQRPVYPSEQTKQQQMLHLDFYVNQDKLEKEISHALACGATLANRSIRMIGKYYSTRLVILFVSFQFLKKWQY